MKRGFLSWGKKITFPLIVVIVILLLVPMMGKVPAVDPSFAKHITVDDAAIPDLGLSINQDSSYKQDEEIPYEIHVVYGDISTSGITLQIYFFTNDQAQVDLGKMINDGPYVDDTEHVRVISRSVEADRYALIFHSHSDYGDGTAGRIELVDGTTEVLITGKVNAGDQEGAAMFAKVEQKARELLGMGVTRLVHGQITGFSVPLRHINISATNGTKTWSTTTDDYGNYNLSVSLHAEKKLTLIVVFSYINGSTTYFSLHYGENEQSVVEFRRDFEVSSDDTEYLENVVLDQELPAYYGGDWAKTFASMYVHFTEALEFYKDGLGVNVNFQLPLDIYTFVSNATGTRYWYNIPGKSYITIDAEKSIHESVYRPMNLEYHEFSHYIMHTLYQRWPAPVSNPDNIEERNHDGYLNPSTSDSYVEGWAEFMSAVILETYEELGSGATIPMTPPNEKDMGDFNAADYMVNTQWVGLEVNFPATANNGKQEEHSIAETLWDLYDDPTDYNNNMSVDQVYQWYQQNLPNIRQDYEQAKLNHESAVQYWNITGPEAVFPPLKILTLDDVREYMQTHRFDDDNVTTIQLKGVWGIIKNFHNDFTSVYNDFIAKYPDQKSEIDKIFIAHDLFDNTDPGDGVYNVTAFDPYRDANHNGKYDPGEYYVDLPYPFVYTPGETVGQATNYNRPWRQSVQEVLGYFIKVDNNVPFYLVKISFPNAFYLDSVVRERNDRGLVYVPVPPQGYYALITVIPEGVQSSVPMSFASDVFQHNYSTSLAQGYYMEHDFQVTGPIPAAPSMPGEAAVPGTHTKTPGFEAILLFAACVFSIIVLSRMQRKRKS